MGNLADGKLKALFITFAIESPLYPPLSKGGGEAGGIWISLIV